MAWLENDQEIEKAKEIGWLDEEGRVTSAGADAMRRGYDIEDQ